jgi:segregation and condensation protein B
VLARAGVDALDPQGAEIALLVAAVAVGVLKTLLERRMVRIAGRKEVVGKPFLYCTSREFLVHFGLKSLKDLPPLEEFDEAFGAGGDGTGEVEDREESFYKEVAAIEERDEAEQMAEEAE